jgi:hypothetical protein
LPGQLLLLAGLAWSAQRWQLYRQLHAEEVRWRRQQRRDAYASFLSASYSAAARLVSTVDELAATERDDRGALDTAATENLLVVDTAFALVQMEGSPDVVDRAESLRTAIARLHRALGNGGVDNRWTIRKCGPLTGAHWTATSPSGRNSLQKRGPICGYTTWSEPDGRCGHVPE